MTETNTAPSGRAARLPQSRGDAAKVLVLLVLLEAALALFVWLSVHWMDEVGPLGYWIVVAFAVATSAALALFAVSLFFDALSVLLGVLSRDKE
ncbi:MAG: hypothetical protein KY455_05150 [Euryarchaeota archaeon]|nr:hypothetical protein [Euryarchaeota archaeon]